MKPVKQQQGVAMIEMAITMSLLIFIVFGITEFGRAIYQYDTLAKAARDAARYLSTKGPGDSVAIETARCMAVHGNPDCTGYALAPGLSTAMVGVCDRSNCASTHQSQGSAPVMNLVTLTVGQPGNLYRFESAVGFVVPSFDFAPISVTMKQVL